MAAAVLFRPIKLYIYEAARREAGGSGALRAAAAAHGEGDSPLHRAPRGRGPAQGGGGLSVRSGAAEPALPRTRRVPLGHRRLGAVARAAPDLPCPQVRGGNAKAAPGSLLPQSWGGGGQWLGLPLIHCAPQTGGTIGWGSPGYRRIPSASGTEGAPVKASPIYSFGPGHKGQPLPSPLGVPLPDQPGSGSCLPSFKSKEIQLHRRGCGVRRAAVTSEASRLRPLAAYRLSSLPINEPGSSS
ncbi:hypothetical protein NDU88_002019 [Pleurodeles waltl]|uniref:Uncharacterized protein n=1 Tax=Pleurodeles waltl TaxID=8319 RepID=A0AAV7P8R5_PLEWA|nr:hypothetical protein NDU88_002019 [Pleurodeles waltl]